MITSRNRQETALIGQYNKLLAAKVSDLFDLCEKYASPRFSQFFDGGEAADISDFMLVPYGMKAMLWGGSEDCERKMLGVFPEWEEPEKSAFPISVVKITSGFEGRLSHRDYLGTVMSLGLDRSKTGDIIIDGRNAYVFVCSDMAQYIASSITKIANTGVKTEVIDGSCFTAPEKKWKYFSATCASLRLDAVVAGAIGISRNECTRLINAGKVKLNYRECTDVSRTVAEGSLISVRGHGRFILEEAEGKTRSGRLHIKVKFSI